MDPAYRRQRQLSPRAFWVGTALFTAFSVALLATAAVLYSGRAKPAAVPEPYRSAEFNYSFLLPGPPWQKDDATKKDLGVNSLCYRRAGPDARVALAVREFKKRRPVPADLTDEAKRTLAYFKDLESEPGGDGTLGGQPAARVVFRGMAGGAAVSGDCHMLAYRGVCYWLYRFCPSADVAAAQPWLDDMRDRFGLLDGRANWSPETTTFACPLGTLGDDGGRWRKSPHPAKEYDPKAELVLDAPEREDVDDPARKATLIVLAFAGDLAAAKAHVLERQREVYPETTIADDAPADASGAVSLRVTNGKSRERIVVLSLKPGVAIVGEADWARREFWEADLRRVAATFRKN